MFSHGAPKRRWWSQVPTTKLKSVTHHNAARPHDCKIRTISTIQEDKLTKNNWQSKN